MPIQFKKRLKFPDRKLSNIFYHISKKIVRSSPTGGGTLHQPVIDHDVEADNLLRVGEGTCVWEIDSGSRTGVGCTYTGEYSCSYLFRTGDVCGRTCHRPEGFHEHWKARKCLPCNVCDKPTSSEPGLCNPVY
ncbi:unnamed protein product [Rhizophagus irregularis]|nr:unnamed protein product [Rhizophagus irregularis]